jgi:hypothetical protein
MKIKNTIISILSICLMCFGLAYLYARYVPEQNQETNNQIVSTDKIIVGSPKINELVSSPLGIVGQARGFWFFEASFPAKILDGNGELLGSGIITAKSDWMTEELVPFEGEISFRPPTTETGTLILEKDNPSDLPQNADSVSVPIRFAKVDTMTVSVYFNNKNLDPEASCNKVFPVQRIVAKTQSTARAALTELLSGTTQEEESNGYFTSINPGVKIQSLTIENGVATVDFDEQMQFQVGGSCRVSAIRAQITETLRQFPTVRNVIISINNNTEEILQP